MRLPSAVNWSLATHRVCFRFAYKTTVKRDAIRVNGKNIVNAFLFTRLTFVAVSSRLTLVNRFAVNCRRHVGGDSITEVADRSFSISARSRVSLGATRLRAYVSVKAREVCVLFSTRQTINIQNSHGERWQACHWEALREIAPASKTASDAAMEMAVRFPDRKFTKNSIIGACARRKIIIGGRCCGNRTPKYAQQPSAPRVLTPTPKRIARPKIVESIDVDATRFPAAHALFKREEKQCKWPIGDPFTTDFHFCTGARQDGSPYCAKHHAKAYQPTRK